MVMGTSGVVTPFGAEKKTSTTVDVYPVGSVIALGDGRVARRISAGEALTVGKLLMTPAGVANHDADLVVAAAAVDAYEITVTPGATAVTANQYQGGKLYFNDLEEEGHTYQIKSHPAAGSATAFVLTLDELLVTAITASQQVGLVASPWGSVEIWDVNDVDGQPAGVPAVDIASGSYGWAIVHGTQATLIDGTPGAGVPVIGSDNVDGSVEALDRDVAADAGIDTPVVGNMGQVVGVDTEYMPVELSIE